MKIDWLIVGAGFTGSVLAERIASQLGQKVLIIDQRDHVGGNSFDECDEYGVLIHRYGPHIFHTNAEYVWNYLSQFTEWRHYYHHVLGVIDGKLVPIPFNLNSLYALFPSHYAEKLAKKLIKQYGFGTKVPILKILETTNGDLKFLAQYIYDKVFYNYTRKQWGVAPEELSPSVTARVPIQICRDNRYFQDHYQGIPRHGYKPLFRRMLRHPNIRVMLNTAYHDVVDEIQCQRMIFTGQIDAFFSYTYGKLPYRSLDFKFTHLEQESLQTVGTVNYPNEYAFTRVTEFKHLTGQRVTGTTFMEEYPQPYVTGENIPYYPVPKEEYRAIYKKYEAEADQLKERVFFVGRLADYQYYNMDQAIARALSLFDKEIAKT